MNWSEVREYAGKQIAIPFEGTIVVEKEGGFASKARRRDGLRAIEVDAATFATLIGYQFEVFQRRLSSRTPPIRYPDPILPWLPGNRSKVRGAFETRIYPVRLEDRFNTNATLTGQQLDHQITVAEFHLATYDGAGLAPIRLVIDEMDLSEGSLKDLVKGSIIATSGTLGLVFALAATPQAQERWADYKLDQTIEFVTKNQPCKSLTTWHIDAEEVHHIVAKQLNYAEKGIPAAEKAIRAANVQVLLEIVQGSPERCDGLVGNETLKSLSHYAVSKGLPPSTPISNKVLLGHLITDAHKF